MKSSAKKVLGEFLGSAFVSFFGLGLLVPFVCLGYVSNMYEFSVWFGAVFALSVVIFAPISGCFLNPGVTLGWAFFGGFEKRLILPYIVAQILGWGAGLIPIFIGFDSVLSQWAEKTGGNPAALFYCNTAPEHLFGGFVMEFAMSALLMIAIFALLDERLPNKPSAGLFPIAIGAVIALDIAFGGGFTGTAINTARDLGPRLFCFVYGLIRGYDVSGIFAGWQWVLYLTAPTVGCVFGGFFSRAVFAKLLPKKAEN